MQQIRCFCAALELGSFTAAADHNYVAAAHIGMIRERRPPS